ncbi:MAG TPA: redoxin domain-containing protein [Thermoanaerobaculia bacterium]|nr:redoxin domain-containing protein [Thermoanaerobaculia bacterium]
MHPIRRTLPVLAVALLLTMACLPASAASVGQEAPAFALQDLDGKTHSLADYRGKTVVLEWINPNCPVSRRHADEGTMKRLAAKHGDVVWLAINSTNPDSRDYMTQAKHKEWAADKGIDYTILYDPSGETGRAYGAETTPHMYVVDETGTLRYNGAIDNDPPGRRKAGERTNYVDGALLAQAAGRDIDPATTKAYGCNVKY